LIEFVVSLFLPLREPLLVLSVTIFGIPIAPAPLFFPLGIGLLRRSVVSRKLLLVLNWAIVLGLGFVIGAFVVTAVCASLKTVEATWHTPTIDGDYVARGIGVVVVGLPLFIWQFRAIASRELKALLGRAVTENGAE
jgi:hypothetical protein